MPNQCATEGGCSRVERTCLRGFAGAMSGADSAIRANRAISAKPATVSGLRRHAGRRSWAGVASVSAMADPRVEPVITYIHDQIRDRVDERRK